MNQKVLNATLSIAGAVISGFAILWLYDKYSERKEVKAMESAAGPVDN